MLRVYEVLALSCSLRISVKSKKPFEKRIFPLSKGNLTTYLYSITIVLDIISNVLKLLIGFIFAAYSAELEILKQNWK